MTTTYHATLNVGDVQLSACGATRQQARSAVLNAYTAWARANQQHTAVEIPEPHVRPVELGQGYADGTPVGEPAMATGPATARITRVRRRRA